MPLKSVDAPEPLHPPFEGAEQIVEAAFSTLARTPEQGVIRIADERFVLMRCESLYLAWFDALAESFGDETARQFVYNTAREIGRSDSEALAQRQGLSDPVAKLACGPVQFAHAGWARVVILEDSAPANDESYFLHYVHPNTFESEVLRNKGRRVDRCACLFSAGYSAGWCSAAFGVEVHGKEVRCVAAGASRCEFVMSPAGSLEAHAARVLNR